MNYYGQTNGQIPPQQMYCPPDDYVSYEEKRKIRHNYNVIGLTLLILYIAIAVICPLAYRALSGEPQYNEDGYAIYSFWEMLIGGGFPALLAMLVFAGYCLFARYNPRELFRTEQVSGRETFRYVLLVLFAQQISLICTIFISSALYSAGLEVSGLNYEIEHTPSAYAIDLISSIILAPIGEELIYRGVVLRCSAKVSQRFAIFFSAFIFGIMHGNPYQLVLGFLLGIPMAIITIKTGSIIPAIICHMANNFIASIPMIVEYFNEDLSYVINWIFLPVFFIAGIIVFILSVTGGKINLPEYTRRHKKRTMPILITSWSMITVMVFYLFDLVTSVEPIKEVLPEESVTEILKMFIL